MKTTLSLVALLVICSSSQACWLFGKSKVVIKNQVAQESTVVYTAPVTTVNYNTKPVVVYNTPVQAAPVKVFTKATPVVSQPVFNPNCPSGRCPNQ